MKTYLAIYQGRARLLIGEINTEGKILHSKKYETGYMNPAMTLSIIKRSLENYITTEGWVNSRRPTSMGLGLVGAVGYQKGIELGVNWGYTESISLSEKLAIMYEIPCHIDNGINGAARAVRLWGYGKNLNNFIYLNIGEEIAVRFVREGKLIWDDWFDKIKSQTGDYTERIAGEIGFDKSARLLRHTYSTELYIPQDEDIRVDAKEVFFLSQQGDKLCLYLVKKAVEAMSNLVVNLNQTIGPDKIILGGSMLSNGFLFSKIQKEIEKGVNHNVVKNVLLTKFNPDYIGLIGAAAIAMNK